METVSMNEAEPEQREKALLKDYALMWVPVTPGDKGAQAFVSSIVGVCGATVSDTAFYQQFYKDWDLV